MKGGGELFDVTRSLARQSLVVAITAAVVDTTMLALCGVFAIAPWQTMAVMAGIVAADLALAAPPRTAAIVAVAQVAVRLAESVLMMRHGLTVRFADVGYLVAGYRAGAWLTGLRSFLTVAILCAGFVTGHLLVASATAGDWRLLLATTVSVGVVPWLVGRYTAARGAYIADLEQQASLREQEQRTALTRAVADERAAIARDLHDVISHHVSAIGIHAGAARLALADAGDTAATRSLSAVESSSRAAMVDLRRQLDMLHGREDDSQRQPGLSDIDGLIDHVGAAGLDVEVVVDGAPVALPDSLDLTLYRIVQEILTNALRHGDPGRARLVIGYRPDRVTLAASNPVPAVAISSPEVPRGLGGIRRRAELFGGTVRYGLDSTGREWHVDVEIPIGES